MTHVGKGSQLTSGALFQSTGYTGHEKYRKGESTNPGYLFPLTGNTCHDSCRKGGPTILGGSISIDR